MTDATLGIPNEFFTSEELKLVSHHSKQIEEKRVMLRSNHNMRHKRSSIDINRKALYAIYERARKRWAESGSRHGKGSSEPVRN